jgi:ribosomal protein L11 methyltransferase
VAPSDVEEVLDVVLPLAPHGVHELEDDGETELLLFGDEAELPDREELSHRCGGLVRRIEQRSAPDGWRGRRLKTYRPHAISEKLAVRPDWAPPSPPGLIDIAISDEGSFGLGAHPTTRACLELLTAMEPRGELADLGCGSGVLAIAAALLGWSPVVAVDADPVSVAATSANATLNDAPVDARRLDLSAEAPPAAGTALANVPIEVHQRIAPRLAEVTTQVVVSGVPSEEADTLAETYEVAGLSVRTRRVDGGWVAVLLERSA